MPEQKDNTLKEPSVNYQCGSSRDEFSALEDSLTMTPWERFVANDDIVNFGDSLHAAMEKRNAKPH